MNELIENIIVLQNVGSQMDVVRLVVVPILSLITATMAISVFSATYFIVFRIKKYLKRHKNYLNFTKQLLTSVEGQKVSVFRAYETTMWGEKLENNKKIIGTVLAQYKNADLKDLILGTYNDDLNSVKAIINKDSKLIKNNEKFIKFQKLFHIYKKEKGIIVEYLDDDYISFYRLKKSGVIIGVIKKEILLSKNIDLKYDVDYSQVFHAELEDLASIYKIYFIKRNFVYKNIANPNHEFEEKLLKMKKIYSQILKKKYSHYNVYIKENFDNYKKIQDELLKKDSIYSTQGDFLLEYFNQKQAHLEKIFSDKIKTRKEVRGAVKGKGQHKIKPSRDSKKIKIEQKVIDVITKKETNNQIIDPKVTENKTPKETTKK